MKLYQKFLYSAFLIVVFVAYATTKNLTLDNHVEELTQTKEAFVNLQKHNDFLQGQIASIKIKNKEIHETMMCTYITKRFRSTPPSVAREIAKTIIEVSEEKDVAAPLLIGIIQIESNFNPYAISKAGARGLMQVMPEWVGKLPTQLETKYDLHDIGRGIHAGVDVFNIHLEENAGNVSKALYYYVNKDETYANKVFTAVGQYLAFTKRK